MAQSSKRRTQKDARLPRRPAPKSRKIGRPKKEGSKDTQNRILDAAEQIFAQAGFGGARVRDIADLAGVTKAMVHYYFESKESLYQAVLDRILFELIKIIQDVVSRGGDRIRQLDNFILGFFDYVARHPHFARLAFADGPAHDRYFDTIVSQFFRPVYERGVKYIQKGIDEGTFKATDPGQLLIAMYATSMDYFSSAPFVSLIIKGDAMKPANIKARRDSLRQLFFRTLGVEPPEPE